MTENIIDPVVVDPVIQPDPDKDMIEKLVNDRLAEALKPMKDNLDKAYSARDEAQKKLDLIEKDRQAAEIQRLKDEGKHREAFEKELAEERKQKEELKQTNVRLTRDVSVRNVLSTHDFKNENATEMAYKEIVGQLVQGEDGTWVHRSGMSIKDFVKAFSENDDNSFLFRQRTNSGGGGGPVIPNPDVGGGKKSLFDLPQAEVIQMAREGKI